MNALADHFNLVELSPALGHTHKMAAVGKLDWFGLPNIKCFFYRLCPDFLFLIDFILPERFFLYSQVASNIFYNMKNSWT